MLDNTLKSQAFKLKGRLYTFTVLQLATDDMQALTAQLQDVTAKAPKLLQGSPIVLDFSSLKAQVDFVTILQILREFSLVPVAIQGGDDSLEDIAKSHGLPMLHSSSSHDKAIEPPTSKAETSREIKGAKYVSTPVRSGQQLVSLGADLIVSAPVGHGAELMADGNIHVYGALRGRALAGMSGNKDARIFCLSLEAELVSIAGFYRLSDAIPSIPGPCQVYLKDEHIHIEAL